VDLNEVSEYITSFDEMQAVVDAVSMGVSVSELHGYQAGLLALGLKFDESGWWDLLQQDYPAGTNTEVDIDDRKLLFASLQLTGDGLDSGDFSFRLLLPDDEDSLIARVAALSDWCAGFFSGIHRGLTLAETSVKNSLASNQAIIELMKDLEAIRQAERLELAEADDFTETERDYTELCEYVRVAAMNIFLEINADLAQADIQDDTNTPLDSMPTVH